jgi:hypothetical protein
MGTQPVRLLSCAVAVLLLCSIAPHPPRIPAPGLVLWAWERPEDLRYIDPATTGVAYLAATVQVQPDGRAAFHFRQQPLLVPAGVSRIAVVRIESPPHYLFPAPDEIVAGLAGIASQANVRALQIDFDARASERMFYRTLLDRLQKITRVPVGITALVSWCAEDQWFGSDQVSEAVPMFFRMGKGEFREMRVASPVCRLSIGVSTDEPWPSQHVAGGRVYVFNPHAWTKPDYDAVLRRAREWK